MLQSYARDHRNFVNNVFVAKLQVYIINVEQEIDGSVRCSGDASLLTTCTTSYGVMFAYPTHGFLLPDTWLCAKTRCRVRDNHVSGKQRMYDMWGLTKVHVYVL